MCQPAEEELVCSDEEIKEFSEDETEYVEQDKVEELDNESKIETTEGEIIDEEEYYDGEDEIILETESITSQISQNEIEGKIIEVIEVLENNTECNENCKIDSVASTNHNDEQSFICEICGKICDSNAKLNKHRKTHADAQFQCQECKRCFTKRYHLMNHMITHTGEKRYKCDLCDKLYTNHGNLDRHIRVFHQKERRHVCTVCGKGFSQSTQLRQHASVHVAEPTFECDLCHKKFKTVEYLNLHKDRHLPQELRKYKKYKSIKKQKPPEKLCICTICGKKSTSVTLHQSHMRTHTGEKPYECKTCGKKFSFQQSLRNHVLLHTGEKPFKCEICGLSFRQIGHLKGHQLVHSGEKRFGCLICNKTFALRGNLTVHMRIHTGETPYQCNQCPKMFYDSNGLKRHKTIHTRQQNITQTDTSSEQIDIKYTELEPDEELQNEIETPLEYVTENESYSTIFNISNPTEEIGFKIIKEY